jgi:acetylornithine deacetylase
MEQSEPQGRKGIASMTARISERIEATELLSELIACPSLSHEEGPYASLLASFLRREGFEVRVDEANNVIAHDGHSPRSIFATHIDTVPPPYLPPRIEGDIIYGRGACDTKGGFVAQVLAARRLRREGFKGLGFVLVSCEETDHSGARRYVASASPTESERKPRIILCEPTNNRLVTAQKGIYKIEVRARGKAAHSAYPERGESAIHRLVEALAALLAMRLPTDSILGPCTLNVGAIQGGIAANIFAPEASATLMFRLTRSSQELKESIKKVCEALEIQEKSVFEPVHYEVPEGFQTCLVSFNTDAAILSALGPVWLVGPGDIEVAHSDNEHISLTSLLDGVDIYEKLAKLELD